MAAIQMDVTLPLKMADVDFLKCCLYPFSLFPLLTLSQKFWTVS
jgi:hypothetical protein